jgi:hypothetical protein
MRSSLSGPTKSLSQGWKLLRKGIAIDDPHPVGVFLGCRHIFAERASPWSGRTVRTLEYDMSDFLVTCVSSYRELTGCKPLRLAPTSFLEDVDKVECVVDSTATPRPATLSRPQAVKPQSFPTWPREF